MTQGQTEGINQKSERRRNLKREPGPYLKRTDHPIDGERMRMRRNALNMNQGELAHYLGSTINTIARQECGHLGIAHPDYVAHKFDELEHDAGYQSAPLVTAETLRQRREAQGMTQQELGALLGTSASTIARWEKKRIEIGHAGWLDWKLRQIETRIASNGRQLIESKNVHI